MLFCFIVIVIYCYYYYLLFIIYYLLLFILFSLAPLSKSNDPGASATATNDTDQLEGLREQLETERKEKWWAHFLCTSPFFDWFLTVNEKFV